MKIYLNSDEIYLDKLEEAKKNFLSGLDNYKNGMYKEAEYHFKLSLNIIPDRLSTLTNLTTVLIKLNKLNEASDVVKKAIEIYPNNAQLHYNRGQLFEKNENFELALKAFDDAIKIQFDYPEAYNNRALVLKKLNLNEEALRSIKNAIKINPYYAEAYFNQGILLYEIGSLTDALESYNKAIQIAPDYAEAYSNRGIVQSELKMPIQSLESYDQAIKINPSFPHAHNNRGKMLHDLKRFDEAFDSYKKAIELQINYAEAYSNLGILFHETGRYEEALVSFDKAIELKPEYAEAYSNRGVVLNELNRLDEELECYYKALKYKPDFDYLFGILIHSKKFICNWNNYETDKIKLFQNITEKKKSSTSFPVLSLTDSLSLLRLTSEIWISDKKRINNSLGSIRKYKSKNKLRIGYYSADFREHPVAYLTAELFELHDKSRFELFAFYFGPEDSSKLHKRIRNSFDNFMDVRDISDRDIAFMSRKFEIDIAIDLTGITHFERVGIFSYRAAPIQLSYLGFLGTMGADYYDYLISDQIIIPEDSQKHYKEKIIYLPSYQVNDSKREIANYIFTKDDLNLPKQGFIFCCFNNNYKINPSTFDGWIRILKAVPGSVLLLYAENSWAQDNLKNEAFKRGLSSSRLIFGSRMNRSEYLARYKTADLFLDTFPYNAGTTASDALWAGLPVLTLMGESFASRVAASLLTSIGLTELITTTQKQYEDTAIDLAKNTIKLSVIRDKLASNKLSTLLFDTPRNTKYIENAFLQIYQRYQNDLVPDNIYVQV